MKSLIDYPSQYCIVININCLPFHYAKTFHWITLFRQKVPEKCVVFSILGSPSRPGCDSWPVLSGQPNNENGTQCTEKFLLKYGNSVNVFVQWKGKQLIYIIMQNHDGQPNRSLR